MAKWELREQTAYTTPRVMPNDKSPAYWLYNFVQFKNAHCLRIINKWWWEIRKPSTVNTYSHRPYFLHLSPNLKLLDNKWKNLIVYSKPQCKMSSESR